MGLRAARLIFITFLLLTLARGLEAAPVKGLGMWVWSSSAFSTQRARERLIRFCLKHGIRHLDVYTRIVHTNGRTTLQDEEAFRSLIVTAGAYGISTASLLGNPRMFFPEKQEQALQDLQALVTFSKTLPVDTGFKGIKYDVEPYCTAEWKKDPETQSTLMAEYLFFLRRARSFLQREAPGLWLAADIPFWWDKDQYRLAFEGKTKRFNEHIQDLTDFVVIMSYRRSLPNVLDCIEEERQYAGRIHKVVFPALETVRLEQDPQISFWGAPKGALQEVVPRLLEKAEKDPALGGVMIHCYRTLYELLDQDPLTYQGETILY